MGVEARQFGKFGGMLRKIDNERAKEHQEQNQKQSKKRKRQEDEE